MNLTAIITCKDRYENLAYCISSINNCNPRPEIVLVDFGNFRSLESYKDYYKWINIVVVHRHTDFFHKTRALNIGLKAAKTKFICFTDVDQIFQPNFFGIVYDVLSKDSAFFVRCKTYFLNNFSKKIQPRSLNNQKYYELLNAAKNHQFKKPHGEGCCQGLRRDWAVSVRGYDEQYIGWGYEDKDLTFRAGLSGLKMIWIDDRTSMLHLPHERNKTYFSKECRSANEKKYLEKIRSKQIVANVGVSWGEI